MCCEAPLRLCVINTPWAYFWKLGAFWALGIAPTSDVLVLFSQTCIEIELLKALGLKPLFRFFQWSLKLALMLMWRTYKVQSKNGPWSDRGPNFFRSPSYHGRQFPYRACYFSFTNYFFHFAFIAHQNDVLLEKSFNNWNPSRNDR